jgi:hypothetical protein
MAARYAAARPKLQLEDAMSDREAFERRLQDLERALRTQRRITVAFASVALVGCLAAFRGAEPEVVTARRFEVVDGEGRNVAGFGIGCSAFKARKGGSELVGWFLDDPVGEGAASAFVGGVGSGSEKDSTAMLVLEGEPGVLQAYATEQVAALEVYCGEEQRGASLRAQADLASIDLEAPSAEGSGGEPVTVLQLSHASGKPTIQGWDDRGNETIEIE